MMRAILSNTRRSSSSAPSAVRISITWRRVRALAVHTMSVLRPIGARRRKRGGDLLLDVEGHALLVDPQLLRGADLELLELLDDREHLLAHRLKGGRHAKADVGQAHVAQALLAERRAGAMPYELVGEHPAHVAQRERVARVLEHAAVGRAQDVGEVLALVGADLRHVRVQARLPAAVAGTPAELDAAVLPRPAPGTRSRPRSRRRSSHDSPPTSFR